MTTSTRYLSAELSKWRMRFFRFWLAFFLPLAIYCGYQAYQSHTSIAFWQEMVSERYERMRRFEAGDSMNSQIRLTKPSNCAPEPLTTESIT